MGMELLPLSLAEANALVSQWHRHNRPVPGHKFSVGVARDGVVVGAVIVGRPVARHFDNGDTLEVVRVATDGSKNACSMLYGAAQRAAFALGYRRLITYTRTDESGSSLKAAGWKVIAKRPPRSWAASSVKRPRTDATEPTERFLWEAPLSGSAPGEGA